jgi:hypothetical protein
MVKKTSNDELNQWRLRYPSAGVSWNLIGDPAYCQKFAGEAKIMLYQLKNRMNLAVPKLKSFMDKRSPEPGTTIMVKSIFGQDFIEISTGVGLGAGGKEICNITFIDFPLYVPPMRNPGEIRVGEVEGVDYFKTYYSVDKHKCRTCGEISWEFLFRYLQSSPLVPATVPISTRVEWPIEPLHHHDYDVDGLLLDHDGTDHTIYSMGPPAWGEVISQGSDSKGTYIVWKAYTETVLTGAEHIPLSRSGLGIMRLVARIRDNTGVEICAQNERIEVDCCLKDLDRRLVWLWDESVQFPGPREFTLSGGNIYYKTPDSVIDLDQLYWYGAYGSGAFWVLPEFLGGCLPFEWKLEGPGTLTVPKDPANTFSASYKPPVGWVSACQNQKVTIRVKDRCGIEDVLVTDSCCEQAQPPEIGYTSLVMGCGDQQTLSASGCGPFSWSCTSGTIVPSGIKNENALYTAPDSNVDCGFHPIITLTDCCGNSKTLNLYANCDHTVGGVAYRLFTQMAFDNCHWQDDHWEFNGQYSRTDYDCDGGVVNYVEGPYGLHSIGTTAPYCTDCSSLTNYCCDVFVTCTTYIGCSQACGYFDVRNAAQKANGCCPINPGTGLPF